MFTRNLGLLMLTTSICSALALTVDADGEQRASWSAEVEIFPAREYSLPEYEWEWKGLSASGFFRAAHGDAGLVYVTDHFVDYVPFRQRAGFLAFGLEYGRSNTGTLVQAAPKLNVNATPFVRRLSRVLFEELSASRYVSVVRRGSSGLAPDQFHVDWETKALKVWKVRTLSEGVTRLPSGQSEVHLWGGNAWMWKHRILCGIAIDVHDDQLLKFGLRVPLKRKSE